MRTLVQAVRQWGVTPAVGEWEGAAAPAMEEEARQGAEREVAEALSPVVREAVPGRALAALAVAQVPAKAEWAGGEMEDPWRSTRAWAELETAMVAPGEPTAGPIG